MNRILRIVLGLAALLALSECSVKKDYDLTEEIDKKVSVGSQILIPVGSFKILSIGQILSKEAKEYFTENEDKDYVFDPGGETLTNFYLGDYHLYGLSFVSLLDYKIPSVRFYFQVRNTIPLPYELTCKVFDADKKELSGIISKIDAAIPAGTLDEPSYTDVVLDIYPNSLSGFGFDGFRLSLIVAQMPSSELVINHDAGISLHDVVLQLPEGLKFRLGDKIQIF